jgi:hypothetical protein
MRGRGAHPPVFEPLDRRSLGGDVEGVASAAPAAAAAPPLDDEDSIPQGTTRERAANQNTKPLSALRYGLAWSPRRGSGWNLDSLGFAKEQRRLPKQRYSRGTVRRALALRLTLILSR